MKVSQAVIVILLVANLIATIWFGLNGSHVGAVTQIEKAAHHELPKFITSDVRSNYFNHFVLAFNSDDYEAFYNLFGPVAKAQIDKASAQTEFEKLRKFFHSVEDGAYTHAELVKSTGNTNIYTMYYAVTLSEKSEFGTKGELKITIAVQGSDVQIYGIRLNAG